MELTNPLNSNGLKRRDFLKLVGATAAALGLSEAYVPKMAAAVEAAAKKPPVIWLHGQECTGCTTSVISTVNPSTAEAVLDMLSIRYHETIMAGTGHVAEKALEEAIKEGGYVLVVEGSIPAKNKDFCKIGGKPFEDMVKEAAANAEAIIAIGACATWGGLPAAGPTVGKGVDYFVKDKPVINIPGCPVKPTWFFGAVAYYLTFKKAPPMDKYGRPLAFFGSLLHDNCPRRAHFEKGEFLETWNDPAQKNFCLLKKGCKGQKTFTDCAQSLWNDGVNFCVGAGAPCAGCTQPEFYAASAEDNRPGFSPLYAKQESLNGGIDAYNIGTVATGAAAAALAVHFAGKKTLGKKWDEAEVAPKEAKK